MNFDPLEVPNYGPQEAVRFLHVPSSTLHYWLRPSVGLVKPADPMRGLLSFKNLIECYVLEGLRAIHGVRVRSIHSAVDYMMTRFPSRHPLADYELKRDGRDVFFVHGGMIENVSMRGQLGLTGILDSYLRRIERDFTRKHWVLYPFMRLEQMRSKEDKPKIVSINPNVCFGMPVLTGTRITTAVLASRYLGGDTLPRLARSYDRPESEIAEAISWETGKERTAA